jgi:hypothetical protein
MHGREEIERGRQEWEEMKRRGHLRYIVMGVFVWIGAYAIGNVLLFAVGNLGWLQGSSISPFDVFAGGVLSGGIWSELNWSEMKRKFRNPHPEEDWMAR